MQRTFCDRCGKEIEGLKLVSMSQVAMAFAVEYSVTSRFPMGDVKKYDLCKDCQEVLASWLNDFKEEDNG